MIAYRHEPLAPRGPVRADRRSSFLAAVIIALAGLELVAMVAVPFGGAGLPTHVSGPVSFAPTSPAVSNTHGDLVVTAGPPVYIPSKSPPATRTIYYQGGNITVEPGGTLIVQNTTLSFVQFVGDSGTPSARLAHIFKLIVDNTGTVILRNSTLTTDPFVTNPYTKLTIVDNGTLTFWKSNIETSGFLTVGSGGDLTLNQSSAGPNPADANLTLPNVTRGDLSFGPTLSVLGGGAASLFSSVYRGLYADNFTKNETPDPLPLTATGDVILNGANYTQFSTPTDSASLTQDYLYPAGIASGTLTIAYDDTSGTSTNVTITAWYGGKSYALGSRTFLADTTSQVALAFPAGSSLAKAINAGGMLQWLNRTGDFNTSSGISVAFAVNSGPNVPTTAISFQLQSPFNFGASVNGTGASLSSVDSYLGLNFSAPAAPAWWTHQLMLTDNATAYLGNLSVLGRLQNLTSQYAHGAIVADATSTAYLFRWGVVDLYGRTGVLPVPNATVTAPYAYGVSQLDNATAQAVNDFNTSTERAIWDYLLYWDSAHGVAAYGDSGINGAASLLLASNAITAATMPAGNFLGDYHVIVTPPAGAGPAQSFNASVASYPLGVANGSSGYQAPNSWGNLSIPGYFSSAAVSPHNSVVVTADGVVTSQVHIGQTLGVAVNFTDQGTAPITNLEGTLYDSTAHVILATSTQTVDLRAPGQNATVKITWQVNDSIVGILGLAVSHTLFAVVDWNHNVTVKGGGFVATSPVTVEFLPSLAISVHNGVVVTADNVTTSTIHVGQELAVALNISDFTSYPITSLQGTLYDVTAGVTLATVSKPVDLTAVGQNATVKLGWKVSEAVTGVLTGPFNSTLFAVVTWNGNLTTQNGGYLTTSPVVVQFQPALELSSQNGVVITADKVAATTARIGQNLTVALNVSDLTSVSVTSLTGWLYYNVSTLSQVGSKTTLLANATTPVGLSKYGDNTTYALTWKVNDSIIGLHGKGVIMPILIVMQWEGAVEPYGGLIQVSKPVNFTPSQVTISDVSPLTSKLSQSTSYLVSGLVAYNGSQEAYVSLTAVPAGGGNFVTLNGTYVAAPSHQSGKVTFIIRWRSDLLTTGTAYTLKLTATYNSVSDNFTLPGTYTVQSPAPSSFLTEKFLGLEVWLWIAIAAAIVAAAVGFLLFARRQAAGKLVECGECGNLVPEDAKVCPKCGAEFESDVVRCSRCSSTIPASSQFCPECAAQLLGRPGEGGPDPERQAYADFTERFRAEAKKELGDNYSEGAFWDWWKRQPSYTPFSQWKVQQGSGTPRTGMTAPPPGAPPSGGAAGGSPPAPRRAAAPPPARPPSSAAAASAGAPSTAAAAPPPPVAAAGAMRPCPNCGKEIPPEYLVCPFCGSVTQ